MRNPMLARPPWMTEAAPERARAMPWDEPQAETTDEDLAELIQLAMRAMAGTNGMQDIGAANPNDLVRIRAREADDPHPRERMPPGATDAPNTRSLNQPIGPDNGSMRWNPQTGRAVGR